MNKIVEYFTQSEEILKIIIVMFAAGVITSFIGFLIISLVNLFPIMIFGGIIAGAGVIFLIIAFVCLAAYIGNL